MHIGGLIEEERGHRGEADALFEKAHQLVQGRGLVELAHIVAFAYGNILRARGEYQKAAAQYRLAAEIGTAHPRPLT